MALGKITGPSIIHSMHARGMRIALSGLMICAAATVRAQCPDGTPPPCTTNARTPAAAASLRSVAVLLFGNRSGDTSDTYLSDGLTGGIIARLSRIDRLTV